MLKYIRNVKGLVVLMQFKKRSMQEDMEKMGEDSRSQKQILLMQSGI
jgi:hypothetical protein